ncbi:MAG: GNAT family N-acetyltransferase [Chloroflexi bacterium]|nr:GNAT family N-acetyltransferase [Chloroflexota bacterium]
MASITVRQAAAGDFDALLRLLDQMDESMYRGRAVADEGELRVLYEAILADPDQRLFLAEAGGWLVGSAHLMVLRHFDRNQTRSAVVEGVIVARDYRRGGVGAALMRAAAEAARAVGCYKLDLTSNMARRGAHRFYSRLGWKRSHYGYSLEL